VSLLVLYLEFFKIGTFAIGGGFATLPFLFEMADKYEWLTREMVSNFLAVSQSLPGAVGVNMAAQVGFQCGNVAGGFLAALGLVSPAIVVITIVAKALQYIRDNKIVVAVFSGLRPAAAGLLAAAGLGAFKLVLYNKDATGWQEILRPRECIIFAVLYLLINRLKGHPVIYIAAGAAAGIALGL